MSDDTDLPDEPGPTPTREGWATRFARRALRLLDEHPVVKLGGAVLVAGMALYTFVDSQLQRRAEARRGGWADRPRVDMTLGGPNGECRLTNLGPRQLREVTLTWQEYQVALEPCSLEVVRGRVEWSPNVAMPTLAPRERASIARDPESISEICAEAKKGAGSGGGCEVGAKCQIILECVARYHREADMQPFTMSRYAAVEGGCRSLKGVPPFETGVVGESKEAAQLQERAWRCLAAQRPARDARFREVREFMLGDPDPLVSGRW